MSLRRWVGTTLQFSLLLLCPSAAIAQQEPVTADQVISRYMEAVGASRFSTITSMVESGDLYGNLTNFWQGSRSPGQAQNKQHGTFESFFKSPNLRFNSSATETNQVIALHGCDGKVAWYIDSYLRRTEFKPKPGNEHECEKGFEPAGSRLLEPNVRTRLVKKKEIEGRAAWEIKVDDPKSQVSGTYYFDTETFLLLRLEKMGNSVTYSDYREVGGIKFPFTIVSEFTNSKLVTTVRELKINVAIDDAGFTEPRVTGGKIAVNPLPAVKEDSAELSHVPSPPPLATNAGNPELGRTDVAGTHDVASAVEVNFPNFTSCTMEELQVTVPELKKLKASADQSNLDALLEKIGVKTLDIARNTPNLIARETVKEGRQAAVETSHDYDYLILARVEGKMVALDEFRLDLKSGDKFQTDEAVNRTTSNPHNTERASDEIAGTKGVPPMSQGFATSWVHFYPSNRSRASFRYLGEENMGGHRTLVLAFAQKPASVLLPAMFRYKDKTAPMFLQGIAWIDPSDFRIMRLRTDLLSPIPEVSLDRWTADIQFGVTRIEQIQSPLQLPRKVTVTTVLNGSTMREVHEYSDYRLFRAQSKIVLNP